MTCPCTRQLLHLFLAVPPDLVSRITYKPCIVLIRTQRRGVRTCVRTDVRVIYISRMKKMVTKMNKAFNLETFHFQLFHKILP